MSIDMVCSPLFIKVDAGVAETTASNGELALYSWFNLAPAPHNHGHLDTFAVGDNMDYFGQTANIGSQNGFMPINSNNPALGAPVFSNDPKYNTVEYFILNDEITPKSLNSSTSITNYIFR